MGHSYAANPDSMNFTKIIYNAEKKYNIPEGLLLTIAQVESKLNPWAININATSKALFPSSKEQAAKIIRILLRNGMNFDVGVMQINWKYHGKEFDSIEEMFNPEINIEYAAKFLSSLHEQYGSWNQAVRRYHSATKELHEPYAKKVLVTWIQGW
jgi:soluble lytic murein transglycosylase-like protein